MTWVSCLNLSESESFVWESSWTQTFGFKNNHEDFKSLRWWSDFADYNAFDDISPKYSSQTWPWFLIVRSSLSNNQKFSSVATIYFWESIFGNHRLYHYVTERFRLSV